MPGGFGGPSTPAPTGLSHTGAGGIPPPENHQAPHSTNHAPAHNGGGNGNAGNTATLSDIFGGGGDAEWGPASDLWFLPAGPAFFQNVAGPGDSGVGMSAEGINVGGMDLLDYMAMDQFPVDGTGPI